MKIDNILFFYLTKYHLYVKIKKIYENGRALMKFCVHCGAEIHDDAVICVKCGRNVV
ncbi:MAG: zinc ribbon domain-containing protein [Clostridia bacterium]|nr:zinc ribbon domain-containing protein [Clostridia bacterium]